MNRPHKIAVVVFAQVPPPEHGQSRMVQLAINSLRAAPDRFEVHHVNARFSETLGDIGEGSLRKTLLIVAYLFQAIRIRLLYHDDLLLYYVPGPAKWSSILRDWALLGVLRIFYRKIVFHWHAIGHGEWAHGSPRLVLEGPVWLDRIARRISGRFLESPYASISVSSTSSKDSAAVSSCNELIVCNGIEDPCPEFDAELLPARISALTSLAAAPSPCFRILFLSHGTIEKGVLDALDALNLLVESADPDWRFSVTFAGGISEAVRIRFDHGITKLREAAQGRIDLNLKGYVAGKDKQSCYSNHEIFLAPSHWESFGLTVVEAMAHGMEIVATASDGVRGLLPEGHPYLTPPCDPVALASSLRNCCEDLSAGKNVNHVQTFRNRFLDLYQIKDFSAHLRLAIQELGGASLLTTHDAGISPLAGDMEESLPATATAFCQYSDAKPTVQDPRGGISLCVYLADQNPGHDRSFGISRMTQVVLDTLHKRGDVEIEVICSKTSQKAPGAAVSTRNLPWGTRRKSVRFLTDHLHPLFGQSEFVPDLFYFPKGYLPMLSFLCRPSVVTIHDTIIQYDEDHYPRWRNSWEYAYWAKMLKHTLRAADVILTVSESSKRQILEFMKRHGIERKEINVTYEPCLYEEVSQPLAPEKENYAIHLASCEPHKRTAHLIRWWHQAEARGDVLPMLHLIGSVPPEVSDLLSSSKTIVRRPFLEDAALQSAYRGARALILPSEIEGFGLPALEAYYLGTPVCFVKDSSVEEVLGVVTSKGGFSLDSEESLFHALAEVMAMGQEEIRECGLKLREVYAAEKVVERMERAFKRLVKKGVTTEAA